MQKSSSDSRFNYNEIAARFNIKNVDNTSVSFDITNSDFDFYLANRDNYNSNLTEGRIDWYVTSPSGFSEIQLFDISSVVEGVSSEAVSALSYYGTWAADFNSVAAYEELMPDFMISMEGESMGYDETKMNDYKILGYEPGPEYEGGRLVQIKEKKGFNPLQKKYFMEKK